MPGRNGSKGEGGRKVLRQAMRQGTEGHDKKTQVQGDRRMYVRNERRRRKWQSKNINGFAKFSATINCSIVCVVLIFRFYIIFTCYYLLILLTHGGDIKTIQVLFYISTARLYTQT